MANPDFDVAYVAKLARLKLSPEETQLFQEQLAHILEYAGKLSEIDVSGVEATSHAVPVENVFRDDKAQPWFSTDEALQNAPRHASDLFIVPKVVE